MHNHKWLLWTFVLVVPSLLHAGEKQTATPAVSQGSGYIFVWAGDAAHKATDFLAVVNAQPSSPDYGRIVATAPIGVSATNPHHTEYEFPADNILFADGWLGGQTFIFDLNDPLKPRVVGNFKDRDGYSFPHSFVRLPNGNVLGTFQSHGVGYAPGGGLVEIDEKGNVVRSSSAIDPAVDKDLIWPYSLAVDPTLDLVITTDTPMGWHKWKPLPPGSWSMKQINDQVTAQVQIFRLSDLKLLKTVTLTDPDNKHNRYPAEPRVLPDGSIYVNTFTCGLYLMKNVTTPQASAQQVYAFPGDGDTMDTMCAVPVVAGHYLVQTVGALPGLVVLDIANPEKPVEVSRLVLDPQFAMPHWIAADRKSNRLVLTGAGHDWLLVLLLDPATGAITIDKSFHEPGATTPGITFNRTDWPHGKNGPAVVHGALFGQ